MADNPLKLSEEALEARRAYQRKYYAAHKEVYQKANMRYWEKKVAELTQNEDKEANNA